MGDSIDDKTLFGALHGELNTRISARAAISTAHLQTIVAFAAGFIVTKNVGFALAQPMANIALLICVMMPAISFYFIALYAHNDLQIGLLNQCLREIEERNTTLPAEVRFYRKGGLYSASFEARWYSHSAVIMLAMLSPVLLIADLALRMKTAGSQDITDSVVRLLSNSIADPMTLAFSIVLFALTGHNIWRLLWLEKKRQELRDTRLIGASITMVGRT